MIDFTVPIATSNDDRITIFTPGYSVGISVKNTPDNLTIINALWKANVSQFWDNIFKTFQEKARRG